MSDLCPTATARPAPRRRRLMIAISGIVGVVALGWVLWAIWFQSNPDIQSSLRTFDVVDDHTVKAQVALRVKDEDVRANCVVRATASGPIRRGRAQLRGVRREGHHAPRRDPAHRARGGGRGHGRVHDAGPEASPLTLRLRRFGLARPLIASSTCPAGISIRYRRSTGVPHDRADPERCRLADAGQVRRAQGRARGAARPRRAELVKRVSEARDEGDLKENAGYHAARDELGKIDGRVQQLADMLERAKVGETPADDGVVEPGMKVTISLVGGDSSRLPLGAREMAGDDSDLDVFSPQSPLGQAPSTAPEIASRATRLSPSGRPARRQDAVARG